MKKRRKKTLDNPDPLWYNSINETTGRSMLNIQTVRRRMYFRDTVSKTDDHSEMLDMDKIKALGMSHKTTSEVLVDEDTGRKIVKVSMPTFMIDGKVVEDITSYRDLVEYHFREVYLAKLKEY